MPSSEKKEKVKQIRKWFSGNEALLVLHYKGLKVSEANDLRTTITANGAEMRVLKNTLTRIALADTEHQDLIPLLDGPVAVVFTGEGDPVALARVIRDFARGRKDLYFQGGMLGSRVLDGRQVDTLAVLPPREVLLAQAIGQAAAPLSGMVGVCAGPIRKMLALFKAVADKKASEPGAAAPAAEAEPEPEPREEPAVEAKVEEEPASAETEEATGEAAEEAAEAVESPEGGTEDKEDNQAPEGDGEQER